MLLLLFTCLNHILLMEEILHQSVYGLSLYNHRIYRVLYKSQ